ncbi:MAG: pyridoxal-phosphate dependent enzyme, partial [Ktedonobacterales bacterium]
MPPSGPSATPATGALPAHGASNGNGNGAAPETPIVLPSLADVRRAEEVIRPHVTHTPLLPSRTLSAMSGAQIYLKAENLQRSGAYKIRGATYKLSRLSPEEPARG